MKDWSGTSFPEKTRRLTSPVTLSWSTSVKLRPAACGPWKTTLTSRGWRSSVKCSACSNTFPVSVTVFCYCVGKRITVSLQLPAKKYKTKQRYRELLSASSCLCFLVQMMHFSLSSVFMVSERIVYLNLMCKLTLGCWCRTGCVWMVLGDGRKDSTHVFVLSGRE